MGTQEGMKEEIMYLLNERLNIFESVNERVVNGLTSTKHSIEDIQENAASKRIRKNRKDIADTVINGLEKSIDTTKYVKENDSNSSRFVEITSNPERDQKQTTDVGMNEE